MVTAPLARDEILLAPLLRDHLVTRKYPLYKASRSTHNVSVLAEL